MPNKNTDNKKNRLSEQEQAAVSLTEEKKEITRKDVEAILKVSQTMSGRILNQLVKKGIMIPMYTKQCKVLDSIRFIFGIH